MNRFYQLSPERQGALLRDMAAEALEHWQLQGSDLELVKYRENAVFKVTAAGGRCYALRIHRPGYHAEVALNSELKWIEALGRAGIAVPAVISTCSGELLVRVSTSGIPEPRTVDLFAWVEGSPLGSVESGLAGHEERVETLFRSLGGIAASVHNQACRWTLPEGFERHAWDTEGLVGEAPFWGRFWELEMLTPDQKSLLLEARNRIRDGLRHYDRSPQRYSLIHADFVPENLMVEGRDVRLIDFDDAGFGWHLFELATALYFIREERYFETARDALVAGYREIRELSNEDLGYMELFLTARGCTYLGWLRSRQETETAQTLAPDLIQRACNQAQRYLNQ